jgi:hypothetical protein
MWTWHCTWSEGGQGLVVFVYRSAEWKDGRREQGDTTTLETGHHRMLILARLIRFLPLGVCTR